MVSVNSGSHNVETVVTLLKELNSQGKTLADLHPAFTFKALCNMVSVNSGSHNVETVVTLLERLRKEEKTLSSLHPDFNFAVLRYMASRSSGGRLVEFFVDNCLLLTGKEESQCGFSIDQIQLLIGNRSGAGYLQKIIDAGLSRPIGLSCNQFCQMGYYTKLYSDNYLQTGGCATLLSLGYPLPYIIDKLLQGRNSKETRELLNQRASLGVPFDPNPMPDIEDIDWEDEYISHSSHSDTSSPEGNSCSEASVDVQEILQQTNQLVHTAFNDDELFDDEGPLFGDFDVCSTLLDDIEEIENDSSRNDEGVRFGSIVSTNGFFARGNNGRGGNCDEGDVVAQRKRRKMEL